MTDNRSFEYVIGTLPPKERQALAIALTHKPALRAQVTFWEDQFMGLEDTDLERPPPAHTWRKIQARLGTASPRATPVRRAFWTWLPASLAALALFALLVFLPQTPAPAKTDYVAVLLDNAGQAYVTALASEAERRMHLQWQVDTLPDAASVQLWAVSRRDGQARSLHVFEQAEARLALSDAHWRLVQDADHLLLTLEEPGGSALDMPSDQQLARGVCVRLEDS
ncbi:anti-sigma factor [Marinimicrobium alkaliphilum]|uniref:anti-sigma factor n=1 Tax=Marinimicrobium alkaliphilum TaxID=2202654 RepID=UPI000DB9B16B|nr:anti-sigma factor [Marinimicrobium alkaliphilum]